jgi:hypothetical protein
MNDMKLKQTSRKGFSARGTGSINSKGLPERSYKNKSFTELKSSTPIRFGEFENLNFALAVDPEEIQLFHLLYRVSAKARKELGEYILDPGTSDELKISGSYTSRVAEIFSVILKSIGLRIEFVNEDDEIQEYDNEEIKEHVMDDGTVLLCTDYSFMLAKRRKAIEKMILDRIPVIDNDELKELVIDQLVESGFIIGPDPNEVDFHTVPEYTTVL